MQKQINSDMERIFKVPLLSGYDFIKDRTGTYGMFRIVGESWNCIDNHPMVNGEYLLAVWTGDSVRYDVCTFWDNSWNPTSDWYEGEPIAYIAWMEIPPISKK